MNIFEEEKEGSCLLSVYDGIVLKVKNFCIMKPAKSVGLVACEYLRTIYIPWNAVVEFTPLLPYCELMKSYPNFSLGMLEKRKNVKAVR